MAAMPRQLSDKHPCSACTTCSTRAFAKGFMLLLQDYEVRQPANTRQCSGSCSKPPLRVHQQRSDPPARRCANAPRQEWRGLHNHANALRTWPVAPAQSANAPSSVSDGTRLATSTVEHSLSQSVEQAGRARQAGTLGTQTRRAIPACQAQNGTQNR